MITKKLEYSSQDMAILIPTKDRSSDLNRILESLALQTKIPGSIIIIDGGKSIKDLVYGYRDSLKIDYYQRHPPGQIRQRNYGILKIGNEISLVCFLDDDLVLEPDAIERMINYWNNIEIGTAGVSFNITNAQLIKTSIIQRLFFMNPLMPGQVQISGYNSRIDNISNDIKTQWLGGGYTVWKKKILMKYPQEELHTRWAIGEDLRYSYPIGKLYPLYVCAEAKVRHESVYDQAPSDKIYQYRGCKSALSVFYFVTLHQELSKLACLWMLFGKLVANIFIAVIKIDKSNIFYCYGHIIAMFICIKSIVGFADLKKQLED